MSPRTQTRRRDAVALIALVAALLFWGALYVARTSVVLPGGERVFTLWDDAMISMQYARNLRRGEGLSWNPLSARPDEEPVQGFSNPGVTLLMAAAHLLPLPPERVSLAIQALALGMLSATALLCAGIAQRLRPDGRALALAAAAGTASCAPVAIWGLQGSDVGFVSLWLAASAYLACGRPVRIGALVAVLAVGPWIRPDAAIYVPLFALAACRQTRHPRRALVAAVLAPVLGLLLWCGFAWLYFGDPLPNTYYLKATGTPRRLMWLSGASELLAWVPQLAVPLALAGVAIAALRRDARVWLLGAAVITSQAYNLWVGGDFVFGHGSRFAVPSLPFLVLLAALGVERIASRVAPRATRAHATVVVLAGVLAGIGVSPAPSAREWLDPRAPTLLHSQNADNLRFAAYLREHTAPNTSLGAHWGGVPPYFSERPAIDVLGKSDRHIAKLEVSHFAPGHSKWDWDYVLRERRPDILRAPSRGLGRRPDFRSAYFKVVTDRGGLTFYLRRESVARLRDPRAILIDPVSGQRYRIDGDEAQPEPH